MEKYTGLTVGKILREARVKLNYDLADMARKTSLSRAILQALENDEYDVLPPPSYIKGYLRSYCKHVQLSGDELIRRYEQVIPEDVAKSTDYLGNEQKLSVLLHAGTSAVAIILVSLFVIWVNNDDSSAIYAVNISDSIERNIPETAQLSVKEDNHKQSLQKPAEAELVVPQKKDEIIETPILELAQKVEIENIVAHGDLLELQFSDESWAEVYNKDGILLYKDLVPKNSHIKISGLMPFHVFLGYAHGVDVTINSQYFKIPRIRTESNTSRFIVSSQEID
jgi:cytoskeleton protein RodZ